jgi:hypothetical protein
MSMGLPDDPRKFRPPYPDGVCAKVAVDRSKPRVCWACKQVIVGKVYRVGDGKFECFRCHNE